MSDGPTELALAAVREVMLGCVTCGNIHTFRQANKFDGDTAMTWAAPGDGHTYRRRWLGLDHLDAEEIVRAARERLAARDRGMATGEPPSTMHTRREMEVLN